ncbi:putative ATPase [Galbibacter orientalis DSM 19592]|uniref:Putative ATPase n=1 Tax=Galbibacter orientalis DSM 19592 TaxID=926559 RepID=I3CAA0_9FLAO|nr:ATP-binding protein [Galbibacter orientalis]EIJ40543.1 putative ATPase [Galbibacter orientalis DSM 19592]
MLLRYNISNFLSFNNSTEFNLFTGDFRRFDNHVHKYKNIDILKLSAIYGANASGKSNLVDSLDYLRSCVMEGKAIKFESSIFKSNKGKPSSFEIEFLTNEKIYIYGVKVYKGEIINEYLYNSNIGKEDKLIFDRTVSKKGVSKIDINESLVKTQKSKILKEHYEKKVKSEELFLSEISEIELGKLSVEAEIVTDWILSMQIIFPNSKPKYLLTELMDKNSFMDFTKDMLCSFDTGIKDLHIKSFDLKKYFGEDDKDFTDEIISELEKNLDSNVHLGVDMIATLENKKAILKKLYIEHTGFGVDNLFSLSEESDGTKRLIEFMSMLYSLIVSDESPSVFVIDEIGRSIHPSLLKGFLTKLSSEKDIKGQLIFTTHESNLLDLNMLRPDEIWFAEKNKKTGNTEFKTLAEFKKIRTDLDIRKGYLNRRFGGIPMLANFEDLNWTEYASN